MRAMVRNALPHVVAASQLRALGMPLASEAVARETRISALEGSANTSGALPRRSAGDDEVMRERGAHGEHEADRAEHWQFATPHELPTFHPVEFDANENGAH